MTEIIIRYYNEECLKDSYLKIKGILEKIRGTKSTIEAPRSYREKGYTEVKCFSSGEMILEKSKLIEKIENELCKIKGINKKHFEIDIKSNA